MLMPKQSVLDACRQVTGHTHFGQTLSSETRTRMRRIDAKHNCSPSHPGRATKHFCKCNEGAGPPGLEPAGRLFPPVSRCDSSLGGGGRLRGGAPIDASAERGSKSRSAPLKINERSTRESDRGGTRRVIRSQGLGGLQPLTAPARHPQG